MARPLRSSAAPAGQCLDVGWLPGIAEGATTAAPKTSNSALPARRDALPRLVAIVRPPTSAAPAVELSARAASLGSSRFGIRAALKPRGGGVRPLENVAKSPAPAGTVIRFIEVVSQQEFVPQGN